MHISIRFPVHWPSWAHTWHAFSSSLQDSVFDEGLCAGGIGSDPLDAGGIGADIYLSHKLQDFLQYCLTKSTSVDVYKLFDSEPTTHIPRFFQAVQLSFVSVQSDSCGPDGVCPGGVVVGGVVCGVVVGGVVVGGVVVGGVVVGGVVVGGVVVGGVCAGGVVVGGVCAGGVVVGGVCAGGVVVVVFAQVV